MEVDVLSDNPLAPVLPEVEPIAIPNTLPVVEAPQPNWKDVEGPPAPVISEQDLVSLEAMRGINRSPWDTIPLPDDWRETQAAKQAAGERDATIAEIREANKLKDEIDPIFDLPAGDLADMAEVKDNQFDLVSEMLERRAQWTPELQAKVSEAHRILNERSRILPTGKDIVESGLDLPTTVADWASGTFLWAKKFKTGVIGESAPSPLSSILSGRGPVQATLEEKEAIRLREQKAVGEVMAASGAAMKSFGVDLPLDAIDKILRESPSKWTPEKSAEALADRISRNIERKNILAGGGTDVPQFSPEVRAEMKAGGLDIDPEQSAKAEVGDPFSLMAIGPAFKGIGAVLKVPKVAFKAATRAGLGAATPETLQGALLGKVVGPAARKVDDALTAAGKFVPSAQTVVGKGLQSAGFVADTFAKWAEKVAPVAVPLAAAASAASAGAALPGLGQIVAALSAAGGTRVLGAARPVMATLGAIRKQAQNLGYTGKSIAAKTAAEIAETPIRGSAAAAIKGAAQSVPGVVEGAVHGAALDLSLAALTTLTSDNHSALQLGAALGIAGGLRSGLIRTAGEVRMGARDWGSDTPVPTSGAIQPLESMSASAYASAPRGIQRRVNAIRQLLKGVDANADLFMSDPTKVEQRQGKEIHTDTEAALIALGFTKPQAEFYAGQSGWFDANVKIPGQEKTKRVIVVNNVDSAPHEAKHAFQNVNGELANQVLDRVVRDSFSNEMWNFLGRDYTERLLQRRLGSNESWMDLVLDASGDGSAAADLKLKLHAVEELQRTLGREATPDEIRGLQPVTLTEGELTPAVVSQGGWREVLTPTEKKAAADKYIAREISAETFDAVFKHFGPAMAERGGLISFFAKLVAATTDLLGGDSLRGRTSEVLNVPLRPEIVEAVTSQVRGRMAEVARRASPGRPKPVVTPATVATRPGAPVGTPEQEATNTSEVAATAPEQPTGPEVDAQSPREILGTFAESKATGQGVKITRRTAPGTPAGAIEVSRGKRREQIETARGIPDDQKPLWEKNFTPVKTVVLNDGSIQEQGWSPEVLAANAEKTAKFLSDTNPSLSPFEIDTTQKTFTASGWKNLFDKVNIFAANQATGLTGKGTPLVIGRAREFGFFEPVGTREAAGTLTDAEANFINYLFGFPLPGKGPVLKRGGKAQFGEQLITEATEPGRAQPLVEPRTFGSKQAEQLGFAGEQLLEVNPLRAQIEQAGKNPPSLIEAWQNLNLKDIVRADLAPELPAVRPVGVTLRAGFQPRYGDPVDYTETVRRMPGLARSIRDDWIKSAERMNLGFDSESWNSMEYREQKRISKILDATREQTKNYYQPSGRAAKFGLEPFLQQEGVEKPSVPESVKTLLETPGLDYTKLATEATGNADIGWYKSVGGFETFSSVLSKLKEGGLNLETLSEKERLVLNSIASELKPGRTQFSPMPNNELAIRSAAIRDETTGRIYEAGIHAIAREDAESRGAKGPFTDGFVTNRKLPDNKIEFLNRDESFARAEEINQLPEGQLEMPGGGLESTRFEEVRRFSPSKDRKEIELIGPDGKKYRAMFDGYMDMSLIDLGWVPQITPLQDLPGSKIKGSTTYGPSLEKAGYKLPSDLPPPEITKPGEAKFSPPKREPTNPAEELEFEKDFSRRVIEGTSKINDYPYFKSYEDTVKVESSLAATDGKVLMVGTGPLPISQILLERQLGRPVDAIDIDPTAVKNARQVLNKEGSEGTVMLGGGADSKIYGDYKTIHMALDVGQTPKQKTEILRNIRDNMPEDGVVIVRSSKEEGGGFPTLGKEFTEFFNEQKRESTFDGLSESIQLTPKTALEGPVKFSPRKRKEADPLKFLGTQHGSASKAWILPSGKVEQLGAQWHHDWLSENAEVAAKYKLDVPAFEGTDTEGVREGALNKGFARVNLDNGVLVVEVREKNWRNVRPIVEDLIEKNLDDIDRFRVGLLNETATDLNKTFTAKLFDADNDQAKMDRVYEAFSEDAQREIGRETQFAPKPNNPRAIKEAAVQDESGKIFGGVFHGDALDKAERAGSKGPFVDGFITNSKEFLDREHAYQRALELKQISQEAYAQAAGDLWGGKVAPQKEASMEAGTFNIAKKFAPKRGQFEDPETIREALSSPGWAVITGTQEALGKWNVPANIEANKKLEAELQEKGYEYIPVKGTYKGVPQGADFLVLDISTYDAQALGKKYKQESVLTPKGLLYGDGTITEGDTANALLGAEARKQEFFSTLPNGLSFSVPLDFSKAPYQPVGEQSTLFGGREYESPANFTQAELRQRHPEAIVPKSSKEKIGSDIVNSPLYKQSENPVNVFADKLVEFTRQYEDNPVYQLGLKWYSDIVPMLKKEFGKDAPMMTELLAASSPNEKPDMNFFYAVDALEGFKSGRFDKIVSKFNEGFDLYKSDKWLSWYNRELKAGNIVNPPKEPTPEAFLANWIYKHDLKPKQSNGQLYGFHGRAILEVLAGKWLQENKGPKVANFVQNLQGTGHEATIDVWADRTMRRIGYADTKNRWRIMPANGEGVSDADFAFSQKAFRAAANKLGIEADSLQGGLWFAEKSLWSENGWGRLDLGSYAVEMGKLPLIRQAIKQRLTKTAQRAKVTPMKTGELKFSPKGENRDILKPGVYSVSTSYGTAKDVDFAGGTTRQLYRKYAGKADEFGFKRMAFTGPDESGEQIDVQPRPTRDY